MTPFSSLDSGLLNIHPSHIRHDGRALPEASEPNLVMLVNDDDRPTKNNGAVLVEEGA